MDEQKRKEYLLAMGKRIKDLRLKEGLSQEELAHKCGYTARSTINKIETGVNDIPQSKIKAIADALNCSPAYIMGWADESDLPSNIIPLSEFKKVPKVGQIACGTPILAEQNIEEYVDLPSHIHADFALSCKGDSMINAGIRDGDIVYIRQQPIVENGEIAAVLVDSEEATLKRFYLDENMITLQAENPSVRPLIYIGNDMKRIRIIGRAVAYTHAL